MESQVQFTQQSTARYTVSGDTSTMSSLSRQNGDSKSGSLQLQWNPNDLQIKTN